MSSSRKLLVDQEKMFSLTEEEGEIFLNVVCGGFAMERLSMKMRPEEIEAYDKEGKSFLDRLALKICKQRSDYADRLKST